MYVAIMYTTTETSKAEFLDTRSLFWCFTDNDKALNKYSNLTILPTVSKLNDSMTWFLISAFIVSMHNWEDGNGGRRWRWRRFDGLHRAVVSSSGFDKFARCHTVINCTAASLTAISISQLSIHRQTTLSILACHHSAVTIHVMMCRLWLLHLSLWTGHDASW